MNENKITYDDGAYTPATTTQQVTQPTEPSEIHETSTTSVEAVYTVRTGKNGRTLYFKNGRLTALKDIPEETIVRDEQGTMVERPVTNLPTSPERDADRGDDKPRVSNHLCIFDGEPGEFEKFVNGQIIYLCPTHYETMTLGKIVAHLRDAYAE